MLASQIPYEQWWAAGVIAACITAGAIIGAIYGALRHG